MNLRQISIVWLSITVFVPSGYFVVRRGLDAERAVRENEEIRDGTVAEKGASHRYLVTFEREGKTLTYEVKSDHYPRSDAEAEKLLATGRQLSEREVAAWNEKERIEKSRRLYWELSVTGFFIFGSLTSLLVLRAKSNGPNQTPEPTTMPVTPPAAQESRQP